MSIEKAGKYRFITIGVMLFALFFGAGNLIFPASMGQNSGYNVWYAAVGFVISGVGLPLMGLITVNYSGLSTVRELLNKVDSRFSLFFATLAYLCIGPLYVLPRCGAVSYEIAVRPLLNVNGSFSVMAVYQVLFFAISVWLAITPQLVIDRIGKFMTPVLLLILTMMIIKSVIVPMGPLADPTTKYGTAITAATQGMLDGYNTLDAVSSMLVAAMVLNLIKGEGNRTKQEVSTCLYKSGILAFGILAVVYIFIAYIGATSVSSLGLLSTGAQVLAGSMQIMFGNIGVFFLALAVLLACLTTEIGVFTMSAMYFHELFPRFSYRNLVVIFGIISFAISIMGLEALIKMVIPLLMFLYPLVINIIIVVMTKKFYGDRRCVYVWSIGFTFIAALVIGCQTAGIRLGVLEDFFKAYVPFYSLGMGWIPFTVVGYLLGLIWKATHPEGK